MNDFLSLRLNDIEKKIDQILSELDSDFIILDIKSKPPDNILSFINKDLIFTVTPYILPYIPYLYLFVKLKFL